MEEIKLYKRYFRKKDPACRPEEIEWIEMTGKEFYRFINSPEGKSRYFIDIDYVVLEVTEDEARAPKAEKSHSSYLKRYEDEFETLSL